MALLRRELSEEKCKDLVRRVRDLGDDGQHDQAWEAAKPLRKAIDRTLAANRKLGRTADCANELCYGPQS